MNNTLTIFNNAELNFSLRTIKDEEGEIWFVGKDVAQALGYANTKKAVKDHVDKDDKRGERIVTPSGIQTATIINESGMYSLIFSSKLPIAKKFKHWVTSEVLPTIRKHGMYMTDKTVETLRTAPEAFNKLLEKYVAEREKVRKLEAKIDEDMPYTNVGKIVVALPGSITFAEAAKMYAQHGLDIGRNRLLKLGRELKLLCEQKCQWNKPTQKGIDKGIVNIELDLSGDVRFTTRPMLTPNGFKEMYEFLLSLQRPLELLWEEEGAIQEVQG